MSTAGRTWAMVLAAGDGTRLASLTTDSRGVAIPKQFCSLHGDSSLPHDALSRASSLAPRARTCVIVAAQHRPYWRNLGSSVPEMNVIVQPRNCGTAHGIMPSVLHILARDPQARIVFLPADHYVRDKAALARGLQTFASQLRLFRRELLLLGIEPEAADPELGYIVPAPGDAEGARSVHQFVEKPDVRTARALLGRGALWNSFIFAAHGTALMELLRSRMAGTLASMTLAVEQIVRRGDNGLLEALYGSLESVDFSRDIVEGAEAQLRVIGAPACGWTDLGTPQRVAETLQQLAAAGKHQPRVTAELPAFINLARQHAQLRMSA